MVTNQSVGGLEQTVEVAHEALISNWATLRAWVNEDREFLLWRERLGTLIAAWEGAQESEEALLRGPLLTEAQKWFDQRSQDLSDQERKFISASRALRERLAYEEKERREREIEAARKLAQEQRLRAEEAERREQQEKISGELREKLAREEKERQARDIEAARLRAQAEAERAAEAEKLQLLQADRAKQAEKYGKEQERAASKLSRLAWILTAVALLAIAGKLLAWEADSGKLLATFQGHTDLVTSAVFSPDARRVLTAS